MITPITEETAYSAPAEVVPVLKALINEINQRIHELERQIKALEAEAI